MNIRNNFARNLKYYIKIKKINRKEICNKLNIPASTLSDWINSKKFPRIESIEKLATFFNINKLDLLEDKISCKKFSELDIDDKLNNEDKTEILFNKYKENLTEYDKVLINCIILQRIKLYDEKINFQKNYIANNIKFLRHNNKLSQDEFAKMVNKSRVLISQWESQDREPTMEDLLKISSHFKISLDDLIKKKL